MITSITDDLIEIGMDLLKPKVNALPRNELWRSATSTSVLLWKALMKFGMNIQIQESQHSARRD